MYIYIYIYIRRYIYIYIYIMFCVVVFPPDLEAMETSRANSKRLPVGYGHDPPLYRDLSCSRPAPGQVLI